MTETPDDDRIREHLLVLRAQVGDRAAHEQLFERHADRLRYYTRRFIGATQDVDDISQETWLTVVRKISSLEDPGAFRAWLYKIARNHVLARSRKRRIDLSLDDTSDEQIIVSDEDDVSFLDDHDARAVHAALEKLSPSQREALTLRFLEDLSYEEIAAIAGCNVGTIRSRIHYGRRALQEQLKPSTSRPSEQQTRRKA